MKQVTRQEVETWLNNHSESKRLFQDWGVGSDYTLYFENGDTYKYEETEDRNTSTVTITLNGTLQNIRVYKWEDFRYKAISENGREI